MKFWIKIENFLNRILGFLFGSLGSFLSQLTPKQLPQLQKQVKSKITNVSTNLKKESKRALEKVKTNSKNSIQELKKIKVNQVGLNLKEEIKSMKGKSPLGILTRPFQLFFQKVAAMEPKKALGVLALTTFVGLSVFNIIFSSTKIYEKTRATASVHEEVLPGRPGYYKLDQKQVNFATVKVPIYSMGKNDIKFLTADFELQMSNRLSVIYIREHETMIRDHLINHVEPMDPAFTMEKEGKTIIKDKLRKEINVFLEKEKVEGRVDDVNILYLLGT